MMVPIVKTALLALSLYSALSLVVFMHSPYFVSWQNWYLWLTPPIWVYNLGKFGVATHVMHRYAGPLYSKDALDAASDEHQNQERSAVGSDLDGAAMNHVIVTKEWVRRELAFLLHAGVQDGGY